MLLCPSEAVLAPLAPENLPANGVRHRWGQRVVIDSLVLEEIMVKTAQVSKRMSFASYFP